MPGMAATALPASLNSCTTYNVNTYHGQTWMLESQLKWSKLFIKPIALKITLIIKL